MRPWELVNRKKWDIENRGKWDIGNLSGVTTVSLLYNIFFFCRGKHLLSHDLAESRKPILLYGERDEVHTNETLRIWESETLRIEGNGTSKREENETLRIWKTETLKKGGNETLRIKETETWAIWNIEIQIFIYQIFI